MSVTPDDVGWYQCHVTVGDDTFSSIGYFLNVIPKKDSDEFKASISNKNDTTGVQRVGDSVIYEEGGAGNCTCCHTSGGRTNGGLKRHKHHAAYPKARFIFVLFWRGISPPATA